MLRQRRWVGATLACEVLKIKASHTTHTQRLGCYYPRGVLTQSLTATDKTSDGPRSGPSDLRFRGREHIVSEARAYQRERPRLPITLDAALASHSRCYALGAAESWEFAWVSTARGKQRCAQADGAHDLAPSPDAPATSATSSTPCIARRAMRRVMADFSSTFPKVFARTERKKTVLF
jgi:hypothetical protein